MLDNSSLRIFSIHCEDGEREEQTQTPASLPPYHCTQCINKRGY